jgi:hypothetical protein
LQVTSDTGWGPEAAKMFDSEDPMIQQMNIIRNYIKQARLEGLIQFKSLITQKNAEELEVNDVEVHSEGF